MNLLNAKLYDPAVAVSKATSALLAMTAFDTTNLRLTVTVPAHGMLFIRIKTNLSGATTMPQVMLGVLNGSTVVARQVALAALSGTAVATTNVALRAEFVVTGLTPGSITLDAAYGVETVVAATNIHYGGPNDTTGNNAWGGFGFEIWDPQSQSTTGQLFVDANGRTDVAKIAGTAQTARDIGASVLVGSGGITAASFEADAIDSTALAGTAVTEIQSGLSTLDAAGVRTAVGLASANLDTQLTGINSKTTNIPAAPAAVSDIPTATQNADALLKRDMSAVTGESARSPINALRALRNKWIISGGTFTVKKEDDTTTAWTSTLTTTAGADPITESDPA